MRRISAYKVLKELAGYGDNNKRTAPDAVRPLPPRPAPPKDRKADQVSMRLLKPLAHGPIARLWTALSLSAIGDQLHQMALVWLAVGLVGGDTGYVAAADSVALLLVALFAGAWVEGWEQRRVMMAADLSRSVLAMIPVTAALTGHLTLWTLVVPSVILTAFSGLFDPALQATFPRLAPSRDLLVATNALFDSTIRLARLVGPTLAGILATIIAPVDLMAVNAVSFLGSALALRSLRHALPPQRTIPGAGAEQAPPAPEPTPVLVRLLAGWRAVRRQPLFGYLLWRNGVGGGLWTVAVWLGLPLVVRQRDIHGFGLAGLSAVGLLFSAYGLGNLLGNLLVGSLPLRRPVTMIIGGNLVVGVGFVLIALGTQAPGAWALGLMAAAAAGTAIGGPLAQIPTATLRQTVFSPQEIAAVYRLFMVADCVGTLTAMAVTPTLLRWLPMPAVIAACGVGYITFALLGGGPFMRAEWPRRP